MAAVKDCHALTTYFVQKFKEKYQSNPVVNRHSARWGFEGILMDLSVADVRELIDYYFTVAGKKHSLEWFLYNYDKLIESYETQKKDAARRAKLRAESEERAKEWRESGKRGIGGN